MKVSKAVANNVIVKLDHTNDFVQTKSGLKLSIDTSFQPERHVVRTGTVVKAPSRLIYKHKVTEYRWDTEMELQDGDRVIMYFLAVLNCLAPEQKKYFKDGEDLYVAIQYYNIYAIIRDEKIIPINGYVLAEPMEDPFKTKDQELFEKMNILIVKPSALSKTDITYAKIAYIGNPNKQYSDDYKSDANYDIAVGDVVVMKKLRDIPIEYEMHAKVDGGRKLFRMQRHDILATI